MNSTKNRTLFCKKEVKFYHGLISLASTAVLIFIGVVVCGAEPQIPLIFSCTIASLLSLYLGFSWEEILHGMLSGIEQALEAVIILLLIGVLVGTWIASGTVPTLIYYGLKIITPKFFLITAAFTCGIVSFAIGAWGTVGTVGLAFMSIGVALGVPSPIVAGSIISGSYLGEIISPLSDATNLTAAVVGCEIFDLMKRAMPIALAGFAVTEVFYFVSGLRYGGGDASGVAGNIAPLLAGLDTSFRISPVSLIPILVMVVCIVIKFPAIPAVMAGGGVRLLSFVAARGGAAGGGLLLCRFRRGGAPRGGTPNSAPRRSGFSRPRLCVLRLFCPAAVALSVLDRVLSLPTAAGDPRPAGYSPAGTVRYEPSLTSALSAASAGAVRCAGGFAHHFVRRSFLCPIN